MRMGSLWAWRASRVQGGSADARLLESWGARLPRPAVKGPVCLGGVPWHRARPGGDSVCGGGGRGAGLLALITFYPRFSLPSLPSRLLLYFNSRAQKCKLPLLKHNASSSSVPLL